MDELWAMVQALHANVPEDKRPLSWSDFSPEQIERLKQAQLVVLQACWDEMKRVSDRAPRDDGLTLACAVIARHMKRLREGTV